MRVRQEEHSSEERSVCPVHSSKPSACSSKVFRSMSGKRNTGNGKHHGAEELKQGCSMARWFDAHVLWSCYSPSVHACIVATVHACSMAIIYACIMATVHACIMVIVHACIMATVHACTMAMHVLWP